MTSHCLHILGPLAQRLHSSQVDAIELACQDTGYELREDSDPKEVLDSLAAESKHLVILNITSLVELHDKFGYIPNKQTILCAVDRDHPELTGKTDILRGLRYLLGAPAPGMLRSVLSSILEFQKTGVVNGLVPHLVQKESANTLKDTLTRSSERNKLQLQIGEFFNQELARNKDQFVNGTAGFPKNLTDTLEELLMNAIWDANPLRVNANRTDEVFLEEPEQILVESICDGLNIGICVQDNFGTFPLSAVFKPLKFALGFKEEAGMNEGPGGAGLGLYMILQKTGTISFEVIPGKMTRVWAFLRADQSLRETQKKPRTILLFQGE